MAPAGSVQWEVYISHTPPVINCCITILLHSFYHQRIDLIHIKASGRWVRKGNGTAGVQDVGGDKQEHS